MKRIILLTSCAFIFIGFLLPWIAQPDYGREASGFGMLQFSENSVLIYLVLLFPILSGIIAFYAFKGEIKNKLILISKIIIWILSLILVAAFFSNNDKGIHFGIGFFLTLAGSLGLFIERFVDNVSQPLVTNHLDENANSDISSVGSEITPPVSSPSISNSNDFDIQVFFQKNLKLVIIILGIIVLSIGAWYLFIKANPEKDAKKVLSASWSCIESQNDELIKIDEAFLSNFESYKFGNQNDAWLKLHEMENAAGGTFLECDSRATNLLTDSRAKYLSNPADLQTFDFIYNSEKTKFTPANRVKLEELVTKIKSKIGQIKNDLSENELIEQQEQISTIPSTPPTDPSEADKTTHQQTQSVSDNSNKEIANSNNSNSAVKPTTAPIVEEPKIFTFVQQNPQYPGGDEELMKFIKKNIQYPKMEHDNNIQGKVILRFVVMEDGSVGNVTVVRAVSPGLDKEAIRIAKTLLKFEPGRNQGKPVRVYYSLPIVFQIQ